MGPGSWRSTIDASICCFDGEAFGIGSIILETHSNDGCTSAVLNCTDDGIKMSVLQNSSSNCSLTKMSKAGI